jgi:hypothetical protein
MYIYEKIEILGTKMQENKSEGLECEKIEVIDTRM